MKKKIVGYTPKDDKGSLAGRPFVGEVVGVDGNAEMATVNIAGGLSCNVPVLGMSYLTIMPKYIERTKSIGHFVYYAGKWWDVETLQSTTEILGITVCVPPSGLKCDELYLVKAESTEMLPGRTFCGIFVGKRFFRGSDSYDFICEDENRLYRIDGARLSETWAIPAPERQQKVTYDIREVMNTVWDGDKCVITHNRAGKLETLRGSISTQGKWVTITLEPGSGLSCVQFEFPPPWLKSVTVEYSNGRQYHFQRQPVACLQPPTSWREYEDTKVEIKVSKESVERLKKAVTELEFKTKQPRGTVKAEDVLGAHTDLREAIEYRHFSDMVMQQTAQSLSMPLRLLTPTVEVHRIDNEKELKEALGTEWVPEGLTTEELVKAGEVLAIESLLGKPVSEEFASNADNGVWGRLSDLRKGKMVKELYILADKPGQVFQWTTHQVTNHCLKKVGKKSHSGKPLKISVGGYQIAARVTMTQCPSPQVLERLISRDTPIYIIKDGIFVKVFINRLHFENCTRRVELFILGKNYLETLDSIHRSIYYPYVVKDANG